MASFWRIITHIVTVNDDATAITLTLTDAAGDPVVPASVGSYAVGQFGLTGDGEDDADSVETRPSSHSQHHSIGDSR